MSTDKLISNEEDWAIYEGVRDKYFAIAAACGVSKKMIGECPKERERLNAEVNLEVAKVEAAARKVMLADMPTDNILTDEERQAIYKKVRDCCVTLHVKGGGKAGDFVKCGGYQERVRLEVDVLIHQADKKKREALRTAQQRLGRPVV